MIVYHGSFIEVKNPDILIGRTDIDFGQGFYVTMDKIKTNNRRLISDENSNEQDTDYER